MDASNVKYSERDGRGRYDTRVPVVMAKMEDSAEVSQRHLHKMGPGPTLREVTTRTNHGGRFGIPVSCGMVHGGGMTEDILYNRGIPRNNQHIGMWPEASHS